MVSKTEEEIAKENDLTDLNIVTRYKTAAEILSRCLTLVIDNIKPDATILSICKLADAFVTDQSDLIFTKITNKGVAFPCCLNQDNYLSNFAPFMGDKEASLVLKSGSLVRIALAAQVDGILK